jgi:lysophospholipase L1-like esterase/catechol 2,3-dioxygenase-like lactoylglutathione lyase family enzyme
MRQRRSIIWFFTLLLLWLVPASAQITTDKDQEITKLKEQLERMTKAAKDRDQLARYAEANRQVRPPAPGEPRVVFLGDSITDGWKLDRFFPGKPYINRGISGQITGQMLGRFKADVIDLKPNAVVILAGTNDIARGVDDAAIENNLEMMYTLAKAHGIRMLLASILPISDYHKDENPRYEMSKQRPPERIVGLNRWIKAFCESKGLTYVDYYSALVDEKGFLPADLANDGLHPNDKGREKMAQVAAAALEKGQTTTGGSRITDLGHAAIRVKDLSKTLAFYIDGLGLTESFRLANDKGQVNLLFLRVNDNNWIEVFPGANEDAKVSNKAAGIVHLCLLVDDINAHLKRLRDKGYKVPEQATLGRTGSLRTAFSDPDGNQIELMQVLPDSMQAKTRPRNGTP